MEQRVRSPLAVDWRASGNRETDPLVKLQRLRVLFVHIGRQSRIFGQRRTYERLANTLSVISGIDKESFHVPLVDKHEAERSIVLINRQMETKLREDLGNFLFDRGAILRAEKMVRGIDSPAPYFQNAGGVGSN